jgi:hypothetical protein
LLCAIVSIGGLGVGNPKKWSSLFSAFQAAGHMRWMIGPLAVVGSVLVLAGMGLTVYIAKELRGMTGGKFDEL